MDRIWTRLHHFQILLYFAFENDYWKYSKIRQKCSKSIHKMFLSGLNPFWIVFNPPILRVHINHIDSEKKIISLIRKLFHLVENKYIMVFILSVLCMVNTLIIGSLRDFWNSTNDISVFFHVSYTCCISIYSKQF